MSFQQIQKYEHGTNKISVVRLLEICDALKVSISSVLNGLTDTSLTHTTPLIVSDNTQQDIDGDPMVSKETTELLKVYYSITDPKKRKAVVKFIKDSMSE